VAATGAKVPTAMRKVYRDWSAGAGSGPAGRGFQSRCGPPPENWPLSMESIQCCLLSKFRGSRLMAEQAALGSALFLLLLSPGFGVQYVIFVAPLLCLVNVPGALRWGWVSGLFIGLAYWSFRIPGTHLASLHSTHLPVQAWVIGVAAWGDTAAVRVARSTIRRPVAVIPRHGAFRH